MSESAEVGASHPAPRRNLALLMSYDGTGLAGWQKQANAPTVQGHIEKALEKICGHPVTLYGCSRTDAGVHAQGHVSNFFTDCRIPADKLPLALDAHLPESIVCRTAAEVEASFNARFRAGGKQYSYYILNQRRPDPHWRRYAYHEARWLDLAAMKEACALLVGEHDFSAFQAMGSPSVNGTKRRLYSVELLQMEEHAFASLTKAMDYSEREGRWNPLVTDDAQTRSLLRPVSEGHGLLRIVVHGSGFLYNMMRILSGSLLYVGLGKISPDQLTRALVSGDRRMTGKTLAAQGLCLDKVDYPLNLFEA